MYSRASARATPERPPAAQRSDRMLTDDLRLPFSPTCVNLSDFVVSFLFSLSISLSV